MMWRTIYGWPWMEGMKLYLASDRQRPMADKTFEKAGSISYDRGNKKDKYFGDGTHFVTGHTVGWCTLMPVLKAPNFIAWN